MSFDLPSVVFKNKTVEETLEKIKTKNRSIGQKHGRNTKLKATPQDRYVSFTKRNSENLQGDN